MTFTIYDEFLTKVLNLCHAKTGFRVFVCVHDPKRRLVWHQPSQGFFLYDTDCCPDRLYFTVIGVITKEGVAALVPARQSLGITATKILRHVLL